MRRALVAAALAALALPAGAARADAFDHIGDGAPLYAEARPIALVGALQRLGVDQLPSVQRLKRQLGGIDLFNPAILAAPGIDVAAPLVASIFEPAGTGLMHTRVAATLRDPATFATFLDAVAASGQIKIARVDAKSALGRGGVIAAGSPAADATFIVRVKGDLAIVDLVNTTDEKKKAPSPAEVARRFPWTPARVFGTAHGARRLFAPESAAVLYVDGRRMKPLVDAIDADEQRRQLQWASPDRRQAVLARQRAQARKCAVWTRAPGLFDDVGLALAASPDGLSLTWAWGTQGGAPLGGLKLVGVDDGGLDPEAMGRDAAAVLAVYAASLKPFTALHRSGPFVSGQALQQALDGCESQAGWLLLVRSWPLALGAFASTATSGSGPLAGLGQSFGTLRNWVVALRDMTQSSPRFAINATFDAAARPMLEMLLAGAGPGAAATFGKRTPTLYSMTLPGLAQPAAAALETLAGSRVGFTVADSEDSLRWAYKAGEAAPADAPLHKPPIARLAADLAALARLGAMFNAGRDTQATLDALARLHRVDGELQADGDLLRLTLRAPLHQ